MNKWRWRWPAILMVSAAIWFILGVAFWTAWAGGLENAAVLGIDRLECGINVPQLKIDTQIVMTAKENGLDGKQAVQAIAQKMTEIQEFMRTKTYEEVLTYCAKRAGY